MNDLRTTGSRPHRVFSPRTRYANPHNERIYALYELAYTAVDFVAGVLFVIGSVLFFSDQYQTPATWCFLVGSICFVLKPSIRLAREVAYYRSGDTRILADRANG